MKTNTLNSEQESDAISSASQSSTITSYISVQNKLSFNDDFAFSSLTILKNQRIIHANNNEIIIRNLNDGSLIQTFKTNASHVVSLVVLESYVISGGLDGTISIWGNASVLKVLKSHSEAVICLAVSNENKFASGSVDKTIIVWSMTIGADLKVTSMRLSGHFSSVKVLAFFGGNKLASGTTDGQIKIWSLISGEQLTSFRGYDATIRALVTLPGKRIASVSDNSTTIQIWDISGSYSLIHELKSHCTSVVSLCLLADSTTLASASEQTIKLWDILTGKLLSSFREHSGKMNSLALLNDGQLVSYSTDKSILFWTYHAYTRSIFFRINFNLVKKKYLLKFF